VALGFGVSLDQHKQAQAVGAVLCTSCVGIETVQTLTPRLSAAQAAAVERLTTPTELLVFYAPWCRSCPYAEELVGLAAARNPLVRYRLANAEAERDLAVQHGVTRAGRTVVPAIVHLGTGKVLFGAEDLGNRLVSLLQEAP
jgi:thiol-disulfide isomerase/thioredoxin